MEILFVKLGALGDVLNTLPLAVNLKKKLNANIHWLVAPLSYPVVSEHPFVDNVILFDKKNWRSSFMDARKKLHEIPFDIVLDLQRILKSGLFTITTNARRRIGFDKNRCKELTWLLPFERIPASDPYAHMLDQYLEFGIYLGLPGMEVCWEIPVTGIQPFDLPDNFIVLNIGATKPANKWFPDRFATLAEKIKNRFGFDCVLTGGPEDAEMASEICALTSNSIINLVGETSIKELKEVLFKAAAVVSCDTGPMHFAVALGKEVVALFGPSNPSRTGPYRGHVIQKQLDCIPCNKKKCDDPICMKAIVVDDVLDAIDKAISYTKHQTLIKN